MNNTSEKTAAPGGPFDQDGFRMTPIDGSQHEIDMEPLPTTVIQEDEEEEFIPVSLVVLFLAVYMTLGAGIFSLLGHWTFFEAMYFVFVSMSTIGFGDYVPDNPMFMMATFVYLLFGLSLTSMCINVIQEKLSSTFQMAKMQIGASLGLDGNNFMIDPAYLQQQQIPPSTPDDGDSVAATSSNQHEPEVKPEGGALYLQPPPPQIIIHRPSLYGRLPA